MKKLNLLMVAGLLLATPLLAGPKTTTVKGVLVDSKCYGMMHANVTNDHQTPDGLIPSCGTACAAMGIPVAVLKNGKQGGEVFILVMPSGPMGEHMAKEIKVTGTVPFEGSLIPDKIQVKNDNGKWEEVKVATMM